MSTKPNGTEKEAALLHLKQEHAFDSSQAMKKLNDCFVQSFSQLKDHRTFEKWLEFLCIVHQSIELTEGVQLTMSENSTCVLKFGDHCENAVDILFAAYNESSPTSIKKLGLMEGQSSSQIEHYNLKIQHLEQELFEKSAQLDELVSKSKTVIQSLLEQQPNKSKKIKAFSTGSGSGNDSPANFHQLEEEEDTSFEKRKSHKRSPTTLSDFALKAEEAKMMASLSELKLTPRQSIASSEILSHRALIVEDEKPKTLESPTKKSSPGESLMISKKRTSPHMQTRNTVIKASFIERVQENISRMIKCMIHFSSISIIPTLVLFSVAAIISKIQLSKAEIYDFHLVSSAECAAADPSQFLNDFTYIKGPAIPTLSIIALFMTIVNYGLRVSLENLKGRYISKWLCGFPLIPLVLETVALVLLFKGKLALSEFQSNFFNTFSINCFKDTSSVPQIFDQISRFYGNQFTFAIASGVLAFYQSLLYFCSHFVVESMQKFK